jgi:hypothetical protein
MEVWVLYFYLTGALPPLVMGEYFSEGRCQLGMAHQLPHWRKVYSQSITPRCVREVNTVPVTR